MKKNPFIGFYNVSVILTYIGLASAVLGIFLSAKGKIVPAIACLMFSGVCDMFDGKIARAIKRCEDAKAFGVQIDSLCDLVCFGVLPAAVCRAMGLTGWVGTAVLILFVLAAVIRLAYFNVTEIKRQQVTSENRKYYQGLAVTAIALLLPVYYMIHRIFLQSNHYVGGTVFLGIAMLVNAVLNILNVKIPKPGKFGGIVMISSGIVLVTLYILLFA